MPWWWDTGKDQVDEDEADRAAMPEHAQDSTDERGNGLFGYHLARAEGARIAAGKEIDSDEPDADWAETNVNAMEKSVEAGRKIVERDVEKRRGQ